jgi:glycosyltransferase involved in cell wall biosynthesis
MLKVKPKICIISEYAYPILTGDKKKMGGAEIQAINISKELIERNYDISLITFGKSHLKYEEILEIKTYIPYDVKSSGYSHIYPWNLYNLWTVINKIDADVYIQRSGTILTGTIAFLVKLMKKKFVFSASSDNNLSIHLRVKSIRDFPHIIYAYGVKSSDCVICQSNHQQKLLMDSTGKKGQVIKNVHFPQSIQNKQEKCSKTAIWIGRIQKSKRPELFIELAKKISDCRFQMIGGPDEKDLSYYEKIKKEANNVINLEFLGFIPHEDIHKYYSRAAILVCTSLAEGFPNIFLEAWGNCVPVVSLGIDPDGIIHQYKLGLYATTFDELISNTCTLLEDEQMRREMGDNGEKYILNEHSIDIVINQYENLLSNFCK